MMTVMAKSRYAMTDDGGTHRFRPKWILYPCVLVALGFFAAGRAFFGDEDVPKGIVYMIVSGGSFLALIYGWQSITVGTGEVLVTTLRGRRRLAFRDLAGVNVTECRDDEHTSLYVHDIYDQGGRRVLHDDRLRAGR